MSEPRLTVLVIDDEAPIRRALRHVLADDATRVIEASNAREGLDLAAAERPDLIVLDLGLPDESGEKVCRDLRGWTSSPILVLSARHSDVEKVTLLDAGADDYVTKPFSPAELSARVRALVRRAASPSGANRRVVSHRGLVVDLVQRAVQVEGRKVHLTPIEWELLKAMVTQPGRVLTHQHLFKAAWRGRGHGDAQQYLRVYVAHLRRKLERDPVRPEHIFTIPGVGYRFGE